MVSTSSSSTVLDNATVLQKEASAIEAEFTWLLNSHFPKLLADLAVLLQDGLLALASEATSNNQGSNLVISTSNADHVKGVALIDGTCIVKGEFLLKMTSLNRGYPLKVFVNPSEPILLDQLQSCSNYLATALETLQSYLPPYSRRNIEELCRKLGNSIQRAKKSLSVMDESNLFPFKILPPNYFSPDLPEDLIIQFHILHNVLITDFIQTQFNQSSAVPQFTNTTFNQLTQAVEKQTKHILKLASNNSNNSNNNSNNNVNHNPSAEQDLNIINAANGFSIISNTEKNDTVTLPGGKIADVVQKIRIEATCPKLGRVYTSLEASGRLLAELRYKLNCF